EITFMLQTQTRARFLPWKPHIWTAVPVTVFIIAVVLGFIIFCVCRKQLVRGNLKRLYFIIEELKCKQIGLHTPSLDNVVLWKCLKLHRLTDSSGKAVCKVHRQRLTYVCPAFDILLLLF
uniref:Uncharacterized protein n=1 Tax=Anser brachyrhynchus TaxID=132585 RepID=A0A8B9C002_9AVES